MNVLVGPVHLGDVHQTLDARLDLDERAVVGDVGDLAEQARAFRIATGDIHPRIVAELLQAERHAIALAVVAQHLRLDFVADLEDFARMLDAPPGDIGDVQQAVDAAEVHERAVVGEVLDDTLDDLAFLEVREQRLALGRHFLLDHRAARYHDVVALAIDLDNFEFELFALEVAGVTHRTHIDERAGQEGADAFNGDGVTALDLAGHDAGHNRLVCECLLEILPGFDTLRFFARELGLAGFVGHVLDHHLDGVADLHGQLAAGIAELVGGDDTFGLQAGIDDNDFVIDVNHFTFDKLTLFQVNRV